MVAHGCHCSLRDYREKDSRNLVTKIKRKPRAFLSLFTLGIFGWRGSNVWRAVQQFWHAHGTNGDFRSQAACWIHGQGKLVLKASCDCQGGSKRGVKWSPHPTLGTRCYWKGGGGEDASSKKPKLTPKDSSHTSLLERANSWNRKEKPNLGCVTRELDREQALVDGSFSEYPKGQALTYSSFQKVEGGSSSDLCQILASYSKCFFLSCGLSGSLDFTKIPHRYFYSSASCSWLWAEF